MDKSTKGSAVNTRRLIRQVQKGHTANLARHEFQRRLESAPAVERARDDANRCIELKLTLLPEFSTISSLVSQVNQALRNLVYEFDSRQSTDVEYVKHCKLISNRQAAIVLINNESVAQKAIEQKTLQLFGENVYVHRAHASFSHHGMDSSTRKEPGSRDFHIKYVEFGVLDGDGFTSMWSSKKVLNLNSNAQVAQIQMVSKVIGLELGRVLVRTGDANTGTFRRECGHIRIEIPFQSIIAAAEYQKSFRDAQEHAVYLPLRHPPLIFRQVSVPYEPTAWTSGEGEIREMRFVRTVDFTQPKFMARVRGVRIFLPTEDSSFFNFASELLKCNIGQSHPLSNPKFVPLYHDRSRSWNYIMDYAHKCSVSFAVRYEVECLHAIGAISLTEITNWNFWHALAKLSKANGLRVIDRMFAMAYGEHEYRIHAMESLYEAIRTVTASEKGKYFLPNTGSLASTTEAHFIDPRVTQAAQAILRDAEAETSTESNWVPIRRVIITPTRFIPCRAQLDMLNRVLRQYSHLRERFIRVTFADENGESVSYQDSEDLYALVRRYLENGISFAGETFVFLGFSSSQLREHSCWFYNESPHFDDPDAVPTAEDIRFGFGDLSSIRVPSKYAARMGQTLSSTVGTLTLNENEFVIGEDIYDSEKRYAFSDGVGIMSFALARRVKEKLGINKVHSPSAYQIRFAGAKGVLAVWPSSRTQVILRSSMCKFESAHRELEVVSFSKRMPFFLNRQFIAILEGLGVASDVFLEIQRQFLNNLDNCLKPETGKNVSLDLLYKTGWVPGSDFPDSMRDTKLMTNVRQLFRAGFTCTNCEFLREIMLAFRRRVLNGVRIKARIPIDRAACGIGVMDEVGVLKPMQIFAQFTDPASGIVIPVQGRVIVGRSPCLHPGDVQVVNAVTHPKLEHLVDVVVFPRVGNRPLPSMLSGGDLDGDIFSVIWDERLIYVNATKPPMNYEPTKEEPLDRDVNIGDVKDFVIRYMRSNNIGKIATAHLVATDREDEGIFSFQAGQLASLHSTAVDFAKTGVPARYSRELLESYTEEGRFPDFLGKPAKMSYRSKKALGRMYRECLKGRKDFGDTLFNQKGSAPIDAIFEQFSYDSELDREALHLCALWNSQVLQLMDHFGVEKEAELISGQVTHFAKHNIMAKGSSKFYEQLSVLNRNVRELKSKFRAKFFSNAPESTISDELDDLVVHKVAAWYKAAKKIERDQKKRCEQPMLSFPYVVSDIMCRIVASHLNNGC